MTTANTFSQDKIGLTFVAVAFELLARLFVV